MERIRYFLLILICLIAPLIASAAQTWWIKVEWNINAEEDLAGYRIYHRKAGQDYSYPDWPLEEIGRGRTAYTARELEPAIDHFFAVTAFDFGDNESELSNEIRFRPGSNGENEGDGGCFIGTLLI